MSDETELPKTVADVRKRVAKIRKAADDDESAHSLEDGLARAITYLTHLALGGMIVSGR